MLLYPSVNDLQERTDSKYTLVMLAAKRARDIVDGKPILTDNQCERPVSQAAQEIVQGLVTYSRDDK